MAQNPTRSEVVAQANDNGFMNTEPLVAKAAVVGVVAPILIALGAFGLVGEEERTIILEQVGNITIGVFILLPLLISFINALWGRLSAFSPRTAAKIAVVNAEQPAGSPPTLLPPP